VRWSDLKGTEGIRPTIIDRDFVVVTVAPPTKVAEAVVTEGAAAAAPTAAAAAAAPAAAVAAAPVKVAGPAKAPAKK
jgi:large subunit ribosomal protein L25